MGSHYGCLLLLFLGVFIHASASGGLESFALVQQWPPTFCLKEGCKAEARGYEDFNIHGLFPQDGEGRQLVYCDNSSTLALSDIKSIKDELDENWRNLKPGGTNLEFWQYQWLERGTCSLPYYDKLDYFKLAVALKQIYNIATILRSQGIKPDNRAYGITEIKEAIERRTGRTPKIQCHNFDDLKLLYQVYICVTPFGRVTDCKFEALYCDDSPSVIFPTFLRDKKQLVDVLRLPSTITTL